MVSPLVFFLFGLFYYFYYYYYYCFVFCFLGESFLLGTLWTLGAPDNWQPYPPACYAPGTGTIIRRGVEVGRVCVSVDWYLKKCLNNVTFGEECVKPCDTLSHCDAKDAKALRSFFRMLQKKYNFTLARNSLLNLTCVTSTATHSL